MCAAVAFLVVRLIRIGRIDGIQLGIPGSMMGTDRVRPHQPDWSGLGPESVYRIFRSPAPTECT